MTTTGLDESNQLSQGSETLCICRVFNMYRTQRTAAFCCTEASLSANVALVWTSYGSYALTWSKLTCTRGVVLHRYCRLDQTGAQAWFYAAFTWGGNCRSYHSVDCYCTNRCNCFCWDGCCFCLEPFVGFPVLFMTTVVCDTATLALEEKHQSTTEVMYKWLLNY